MAKTDWIKIKNEYINTNISQRMLAEKYRVSFNTLKHKANKEKWAAERKKQYNKITTKLQQKTAEKIASAEVDRISKVLELSDKLTMKIEKAIEQLESVAVDGHIIQTGFVDTYRLRQIVQSMKDIKDIARSEDKSEEIFKVRMQNMITLSDMLRNPEPDRNIEDFENGE